MAVAPEGGGLGAAVSVEDTPFTRLVDVPTMAEVTPGNLLAKAVMNDEFDGRRAKAAISCLLCTVLVVVIK